DEAEVSLAGALDFLIGQGYSMSDLRTMTWDQIELYAEKATKRHGTAMLMQAQMHAIGTSTGFSGDTKALDALARQVSGASSLEVTPGEPSESSTMGNQLAKLSQAAGVRIVKHGSNSRGTVDRAGSVHKRVRRAT
ncbi:MAG: hypothetical protein V3T64_04250, partial [Myxococcota bacterium]